MDARLEHKPKFDKTMHTQGDKSFKNKHAVGGGGEVRGTRLRKKVKFKILPFITLI